jgi:hypothetical protein
MLSARATRILRLTGGTLLSALTLFACGPESYDPPAETAHEAAIRKTLSDLLRASRYQELDTRANGLQLNYEQGDLTDIALLHVYRAFYDTDPGLESNYARWMAVYPNSYAARVAHGIYLRRRAYDARGCDYIENTTQRQIAAMESLLGKAMEEYQRSVSLTAKPILSYHAILGVAMLEGDAEATRAMLESGCRIDSRNYIVRYKYFATLQTRWGGSLQQMIRFRDQAKQAGLTPRQLDSFDRLIETERAWLAQNRGQ